MISVPAMSSSPTVGATSSSGETLGSGNAAVTEEQGDGQSDREDGGTTAAAIAIVTIVLCCGVLAVYVRRRRTQNGLRQSAATATTSTPTLLSYGGDRPGGEGGRERSTSRSRSRRNSTHRAKANGGNGTTSGGGSLYAPLELAKGTPMTYGHSGDSGYGTLSLGETPTYGVAGGYAATTQRYRPLSSTEGLYTAVGDATSSNGTYGNLALSQQTDVNVHGYGNTRLATAAKASNHTEIYTAPAVEDANGLYGPT